MRIIDKPANGVYPFPDTGAILYYLEISFLEIRELINSVPTEKLYYRHQKDKWSIKEILVHLVDDERIYAYRALCFARNEKISLPGFDQDAYNRYAGADKRELANIFREYESVRQATIALFEGLPEDSLDRIGMADGKSSTARALLWHIAGHELHHVNIIKSQYL
jgi:uncharacterized damage-inducible protein DinB